MFKGIHIYAIRYAKSKTKMAHSKITCTWHWASYRVQEFDSVQSHTRILRRKGH